MWAAIRFVRTMFPRVKHITTETLFDLQKSGVATENVVLVDCRDKKEFAVSHLAGARHADYDCDKTQLKQLLDSLPQEKPSKLVIYCSIGFRASVMAKRVEELMSASGKEAVQNVDVYNLEGSLFQWANEGRPMVDPSGQPTSVCHQYSTLWGLMLLNKEVRSSGGSSVD